MGSHGSLLLAEGKFAMRSLFLQVDSKLCGTAKKPFDDSYYRQHRMVFPEII
jgi:hypothetical protein